MTAVDLDALDKLRGAATPGPWWKDGTHVLLPWEGAPHLVPVGAEPDAALIVAAVNALPELLAEARKYRALREAVERLIATAPVMRFGNGYPVRAVPLAEMFSLRAVVATVDGEQ